MRRRNVVTSGIAIGFALALTVGAAGPASAVGFAGYSQTFVGETACNDHLRHEARNFALNGSYISDTGCDAVDVDGQTMYRYTIWHSV